jgi:DNA polymerase-3 subunit alpha
LFASAEDAKADPAAFTVGAGSGSDAEGEEAAELKARPGRARKAAAGYGLSPGTTDEEYQKRLAFEIA